MSKREDTAGYVAQLAGELAAIAQAANLPLSAYLLQMAQLEAVRALHPDGVKASRTTRPRRRPDAD